MKLKQNFIFTGTISFAIGVGNISLVMMLISLLEFSFSLKTILFSHTIICLIGYLILIYQKRYFKPLENVVKNNKDSFNRNININKISNKNEEIENAKNNINIYKNKNSKTRNKKIKNYFVNIKRKKLKIKILNYKNYSKVFIKQKLFKFIETILIILILFQVLTSIFITVIFPVRFWDAITCWSFKGGAFFLDKNIYDFYNKHSYEFSHPSYPILLPLLQSYMYFSMGILNENLMKIIFPIFFISLLIAIYSFLRLKYLKIVSLFFTFMLSTVPIIYDHAYIEYTNLPFAFYLFLSVMFMTLWIRFNDDKINKNRLIILSAIFSAQLPLLRSEGILFLAFIFALSVFYLFKPKEYIFKSNKYKNKSILLKEDNKINLNHKDGLNLVVRDKELPLKENNKISGNLYKYKKIEKYYKKGITLFLVLIVILILITPWLFLKSKFNLSLFSVDWDGFQNSIIIFKENFINSIFGLLNELLFSKYDSTNSFFKSSYSIYWIIIILTFVIFPKKVFSKENGVILSIIIFSLIIYIMGSSLVSDFLTSIERYLLHILPISFFLAVGILSEKLQFLIKN